jgi:hypothetical protein
MMPGFKLSKVSRVSRVSKVCFKRVPLCFPTQLAHSTQQLNKFPGLFADGTQVYASGQWSAFKGNHEALKDMKGHKDKLTVESEESELTLGDFLVK